MRLAAAAVLAALALGVPAALAAPALRVGLAPLTVRGTAFHPHERVTLRVAVGTRTRRVVFADARGAFAAVFRNLDVDRCSVVVVSAVGSLGSRALWRHAQPECAPQ